MRRAVLGIEGQQTDVPRHIARHTGIEQARGVRVMRVVPSGPAEHADIKSGDLILAIDDVAVLGIDDLLRVLDHERVGKDVKVTLLRKGERRERYVAPVESR